MAWLELWISNTRLLIVIVIATLKGSTLSYYTAARQYLTNAVLYLKKSLEVQFHRRKRVCGLPNARAIRRDKQKRAVVRCCFPDFFGVGSKSSTRRFLVLRYNTTVVVELCSPWLRMEVPVGRVNLPPCLLCQIRYVRGFNELISPTQG